MSDRFDEPSGTGAQASPDREPARRPARPGRPRSFTNEDVFAATARALARTGGDRLTMQHIANELGTSAQAVLHRFGSRKDVLTAYLRWLQEQSSQHFDDVRRRYPSPTAAMRARLLLPWEERPEEVGTPDRPFHPFIALLMLQRDSAMSDLIAERFRLFERDVESLLEAAERQGELRIPDRPRLAHLLLIVMIGEGLNWVLDPVGTFDDRIASAYDDLILPYQIVPPTE